MSEHEPFIVEKVDQTLVISPTRNVSTLADENVDRQIKEIKNTITTDGEVGSLIFDLGKIDYFGSSMLEAMLTIRKSAESPDEKIAICSASETSEEVLKVSRFDTLWRLFKDRDEALAAINT